MEGIICANASNVVTIMHIKYKFLECCGIVVSASDPREFLEWNCLAASSNLGKDSALQVVSIHSAV